MRKKMGYKVLVLGDAKKSYKIVRLFSFFESCLKERSGIIRIYNRRRSSDEYDFEDRAFMQILWFW